MIDLRLRTNSADNADDVETNGVGAVCLNVVVDGRLQTLSFLVVDGFLGISKQSVTTGLHFHDIRKLLVHYEQIIDMTQELEENENGFFKEENLRYIHLFMNLLARRHDSAASLRDYTMQVRDLYHAQLEERQNRVMTLLTVVTTIFMPLTLIVGWYGMNFRYMPELEWRWGYPVVIAVSVIIAIACLIFFKKKKWL